MASPVAPTVSATGISAPTFAQIQAYLIAGYQGIFGADVYLGNDSQDGQLIGIFAQALADSNAATVADFNSRSPSTAQGVGLSSVVKINGLKRNAAVSSIVTLTVNGVANTTVITNGQAGDSNNNVWNLPAVVTIPASGTINVTATCATPGAIAANPGTITEILTPTLGWQSVTNPGAAVPGALQESDAALRNRQSNSTELPSQTIFEGIVAAIEQVAGVTRAQGYENNTNVTNANGIPARNLAFVVENGSPLAIATAINSKMPPGIPTYGTTSQSVTDAAGATRTINYSVANESTIDIQLTLTRLTGWSTAAEAVIQASIVAYLDALPIGSAVSYTGLFIPAYQIGAPYQGTYNINSMLVGKNGGAMGNSDVPILWNEAPIGNAVNITFVLL